MNLGKRRPYALLIVLLACARNRLSQPTVAPLPTGIWQVRMDVDSAPTRRLSRTLLVGTLDFTTGVYKIDLLRAISSLPQGAHVARLSSADPSMTAFKIVLGDSASFDQKIIMTGRLVAADSIVGTWTETILCCSAAGRFSLWRPKPAKPH